MERVTFLIEDSGERISCMLNPERVVLRRTTGLVRKRSLGSELEGAPEDLVLRTGGGTTEIELDLLFDLRPDSSAEASGAPSDVREVTRPFWQLTERSNSGSRAATARLIWGRSWNVRIVIDALAERLEEFSPDGAPRRSWLRARLLRVAEEAPRSLDEVQETSAPSLSLDPGFADSALDLELPDAVLEGASGEEVGGSESMSEQAAIESGLWDWAEELTEAAEQAAIAESEGEEPGEELTAAEEPDGEEVLEAAEEPDSEEEMAPAELADEARDAESEESTSDVVDGTVDAELNQPEEPEELEESEPLEELELDADTPEGEEIPGALAQDPSELDAVEEGLEPDLAPAVSEPGATAASLVEAEDNHGTDEPVAALDEAETQLDADVPPGLELPDSTATPDAAAQVEPATELRFATPVSVAVCLFVVMGEALEREAAARPLAPTRHTSVAVPPPGRPSPVASTRVAKPAAPPRTQRSSSARPRHARTIDPMSQSLLSADRELWYRLNRYSAALEKLAVESVESYIQTLERSLRQAKRHAPAEVESLEDMLKELRETKLGAPPPSAADRRLSELRQKVPQLWAGGERERARLLAECLKQFDRFQQQIRSAEQALDTDPGIVVWRDALIALEGTPVRGGTGGGPTAAGQGSAVTPTEPRRLVALRKLLRLESDLPHALRAQLEVLVNARATPEPKREARRTALEIVRGEHQRRVRAQHVAIHRAHTPEPNRPPANRMDRVAQQRFGNAAEWRRLWSAKSGV